MKPDDVDDVPYCVVGIVFEPVMAGDEHISPVDRAEDSIDFVASVLVRHGLVAGLLDGAVVGAAGWVLVQTLEFDDGSIARWTISGSAAGHFERIGVYELRMALEAETGRRVQIGTTLTLPNGVFEEGDFQGTTPDWVEGQTLVGRWPASDGPMIANTVDEPVWLAALPRSAEGLEAVERKPFAVLAPDGTSGLSLWAIAAWPSKPPVLKFYRNGPWRGVSVFARRGALLSVEWGPVWTVVDPSGNQAGAKGQEQADQLVREALERLEILGIDDDAADMAVSLLPRKRWWAAPATGNDERLNRVLRALRNRLSPDPFSEIAAALGMPLSVADIAEGRVHPRKLPGAKRYEAEGLMRATSKSAAMEADEPGLANWLYLRWIDRPWDYWVYCILFGPGLVAIAGVELNNHTSRWPAWLLRAAVVVGALTTADMLVPRKWRRLSSLM